MDNVARCWLYDASSLVREGYLDEAYARLQQALNTFQELAAPVDVAKTHFQLAHYAHLCGEYLEAENAFLVALKNFQWMRSAAMGWSMS